MKLSIARREARKSASTTTPHPRESGKETAMRHQLMAAIMAVFVFVFAPATAFAQPAAPAATATPSAEPAAPAAPATPSAAPPAAPAPAPDATNPNIFPVASWEELVQLVAFVDAWWRLKVQKGYVQEAKKSADDTLRNQELSNKFNTLFGETGLGYVLNATGDIVPAEPFSRMMAYLKANGCEETDAGWPKQTDNAEDGCRGLYKKVAAIFDEKVSAASNKNSFTAIARRLRATADDYKGGDQVILVHGALAALHMALPEAQRFWALSSDDFKKLVGRKACQGETCGTITGADADGVTFEGLEPTLSFSELHPISLSVRIGDRIGVAGGYVAPANMPYAMLVARYQFTDWLSAHAGLGAAWMAARSEIGVDKNDPPTIFAGMLGASVRLGDSPVWRPVLELNATLQGERPGIEGGVGAEFFPDRPFFLQALVTGGYYPTGKIPHTHRRKEVPSFALAGAGLAVQMGYEW
ncbi:MAG: hypothetical protein KJ597_07570 [Nanoarchaeota archaeon]|nr:hypothetical protein [Nanoarchaeota archaeon]